MKLFLLAMAATFLLQTASAEDQVPSQVRSRSGQKTTAIWLPDETTALAWQSFLKQ